MKRKYLSDIELYYTSKVESDRIELSGDEYKHIVKVMRHTIGDVLHVTDGLGKYYKTTITEITKQSVMAEIIDAVEYQNKFENIYFCFPRLKSNDRFEFELEKSIELGITNFIIINTERTIPKGDKLERWSKIALAAMKQSLRTFLPKIEYLKSIDRLKTLDGEKIIFNQNSDKSLIDYLNKNRDSLFKNKTYFIFGPEGGLSKSEIDKIKKDKLLTLTENRLRAETAVISAAAAISLF